MLEAQMNCVGTIFYFVALEVSPERCAESRCIRVHFGTVIREDLAVYHECGCPQILQALPGEFGKQGGFVWTASQMKGCSGV
jgi:hypothetical protein